MRKTMIATALTLAATMSLAGVLNADLLGSKHFFLQMVVHEWTLFYRTCHFSGLRTVCYFLFLTMYLLDCFDFLRVLNPLLGVPHGEHG